MAYDAKKPSKSEKKSRDVLVKVEGYFRSALDHPTWRSWRLNAIKCFKYRENDQWTTVELGELATRGQPPTVNNQISVTIERLVGQFVKFKTRLAFRGRNAAQDDPLAQAYTDIFRFIAQNSSLEFEERDMAEDGFTGGFGVLETGVTFGDDYQPEITIKQEDCFNVFPDPYSRRYDWNEDAKFVCRAKWLDLDEAKSLYPGKATELESFTLSTDMGMIGNVDSFKKENYVDQYKRMVRIVECWWKESVKESICLFANGSVVDKTNMILTGPNGEKQEIGKKELEALKSTLDYQEIDRIKPTMHVTTFTGGVLLEEKDSDRERFPWVAYYAHRMKSGEPYSLVLLALPMQDAINKRESKALHLLNTNRAIFQQNAVADKDELATEMARPDGLIEVRNVEQFKIDSNLELAVSQFNMHNQAKADFRHITGVNPEALGEPSEVRSGVGIARKVAMTDLIIAPLFDNLRRTRVALAKNVLELVQKYYTEPKVFNITDDMNQTKVVTLNQRELNDKQTIYDVIADEVPDISTLQQEQYQILSQTLPSILQFGPFWAKMFIQMSDLRGKEDLIKMIEQQSQPPPAEPKIAISAQLDNLTAPERAFFYQKMGNPELAQALIEANVPPTTVLEQQSQAAGEQAEMQADMQREGMKQQGDKAKLQVDMIKSGQDMQMAREKHHMELVKMKMDVQATGAKTAMAIATQRAKVKSGAQGN